MKQRIIGAIVLVAVLVIFLPVLFHRSRPTTQLQLSTKAPKAPSQAQTPLQLPAQQAAKQAKTQQDNQKVDQTQNTNPSTTLSTAPGATQTPANTHTANTSPTPPTTKSTDQYKPLVSQSTLAPATPTAPAQKALPPAKSATSPKALQQYQALQQTQNQKANQPGSAIQKDIKTIKQQMAKTPAAIQKATTPKADKTAKKVIAEPAAPKVAHQSPLASEPVIHKPYMKTTIRMSAKKSTVMGKAWTVQLGTFASSANATRLVKKLRGQGFNTYMRKIQDRSGKTLTRVFVGPEIRRSKAQQLQQKLKAQLKLVGFVKKYKI